MNETTDTVAHLAGPEITVDGRVLQRCLICGAKLCDSLGYAAPLNADGSVHEYPTFPKGRFVNVSVTGSVTGFTVLDDTDKLPDNWCEQFI